MAKFTRFSKKSEAAVSLSSRPAAREDFAPFFDVCNHDARADQGLRHAVDHESHLLLDSQAAISLIMEDQSNVSASSLAELLYVDSASTA